MYVMCSKYGDGVKARMYKLTGKFEDLNEGYAGQKTKRWGIFQKILGDSGNIHFRKPSLGKTQISKLNFS